jgi:hypothetical protein
MRVSAYILDRCSVGSEIMVDGKLVHMLLNMFSAPPGNSLEPRDGCRLLEHVPLH